VVVADFNIVGFAIHVSKADSPLVVDGNRVLAIAITAKRVQSVARRNPKIAESSRRVYLLELSYGPPQNIRRKPTCLAAYEKFLRSLVGKSLDHNVKRNASRDTCQVREKWNARLTIGVQRTRTALARVAVRLKRFR